MAKFRWSVCAYRDAGDEILGISAGQKMFSSKGQLDYHLDYLRNGHNRVLCFPHVLFWVVTDIVKQRTVEIIFNPTYNEY